MISTVLDDLNPTDLGLPPKFATYRQIQREMSEFGLYGYDGKSAKRSRMIGAPTGAGKTLLAHTIGKMSGMRYAVVTATRGLEDQQNDDGLATRDNDGKRGLNEKYACFNIRGRNNYHCLKRAIMSKVPNTCDDGYDRRCSFVGSKQCTYGKSADIAKYGNILTNYQYWMSARSRNRAALDLPDGIGDPIELVIFDEFHLAPDELARHLGVWVKRDQLAHHADQAAVKDAMRSLGGKDWAFVGREWVHLFELMSVRVRSAMDHIKLTGNRNFPLGFPTDELAYREDEEFRSLDDLQGKLGRLKAHGSDGNWIWKVGKDGIKFDCVWPYRYAEQYLFQGVKKVVGMSATLRPKCMALLGLKRNEYDFKEWPRIFPPHLSPVYYWPLGRMGTKAPAEDLAAVYKGIDDLWTARRDRKMLIQSVSYDLAETFQEKCVEAGRHMILSKRGEAMSAAEKFRKAGPGAVLSSPSFLTGWDFANSSCEVIVIPKLPYSYRGDHVFQARENDPSYELYKVMQDVVQGSGRASRHEKDRSECFILDKNWARFEWQAREHKPQWYKTRKIDKIPKCPVKM